MKQVPHQDLRVLRSAMGWSVQDLAYRLAVDPGLIGHWEEGSREVDEVSAARIEALFRREATRRRLHVASRDASGFVRAARDLCLRRPHDECAIASSTGDRRREAVEQAGEECRECRRYARAVARRSRRS